MTTARKLVLCLQAAPWVVGAAIALAWFSWQGALAGAAATWLLRSISYPVIRRIHARTVFAAWGAYVDPGFIGEPRLVQLSTLAAREVEAYEPNDDGSEPKDWLLPDGAWMENVVAPLQTSPDGRYAAARRDLRGSSFLLYDKLEHVRYDYEADDAPGVYGALFTSGAETLAAVLGRAERTPLRALRGMWLDVDGLPEQGERVIQKVLSPKLMLTATRIWPDDLRTAAKPFEQLFEQVRRLSLNGFATPFLCQDLDQAIASPDGKSLLVRGCVVDEEFSTDGERWYYRGPDGVWITLDTFVCNSSRSFLGHLKSVTALTATEAVFEISVMQGDAGSCWIQTARQALPFRVPVTSAGDVVTCRVPLQKFA
jgi:hypothetical protein